VPGFAELADDPVDVFAGVAALVGEQFLRWVARGPVEAVGLQRVPYGFLCLGHCRLSVFLAERPPDGVLCRQGCSPMT